MNNLHPHTTPPFRLPRTLLAVSIWIVSLLTLTSPAHAEGPGYAGNADTLTVEWVTPNIIAAPPDVPQSGTTPPKPGISTGNITAGKELRMTGYGFRSGAMVSTQIGSYLADTSRANNTGTLTVTLPGDTLPPNAPGTSILATGLGPSGTTITLIGSIPPLPTGPPPTLFLTIFTVSVAVLYLFWRTSHQLRSRNKTHNLS